MIENFRMFRVRDLIAVFVFSVLWLLLSFFINKFLSPQLSYMLSLLVLAILLSFTVYLVRNAGTSTLFLGVSALLTYGINDFGVVELNKIAVFLIAGLVFELVFLLFRIKHSQMGVLVSTSLAIASIPFIIGFLLSPEVLFEMILSVINLMLISFFAGIIGSVISFLIWYYLRNTKFILRFEYV